MGTPPDNQQCRELADEARHLVGDIVEILGPERSPDISRQLIFPTPLHLRLHRLDFHCLDPRYRLSQEGLAGGTTAKLLIQALPE